MVYYKTGESLISPSFSIILVLFLLTSCQAIHVVPLVKEARVHQPPPAEILFLNGDFEQAKNAFNDLFLSEESPEKKNHALYGLACTELILAMDDVSLLDAIQKLQKWDAQKGSEPFVENHHLLILALKQQGELIQRKNKIQVLREKNKNILIKGQKKEITQMSAIMHKLQSQIEELEEIDQALQEKRQPL